MDPNNQDQTQQDNTQQPPPQDDAQLPNPTVDEPVQPLPQDGDTPFSEPSDVPKNDMPVDQPPLDTNVQPEETYDEGRSGAVEDQTPPQEPPAPVV